jgi:hypothetical protein
MSKRKPKDWPRYMRPVPLATGQMGYFWTMPTWARPKKQADGSFKRVERHGVPCTLESRALGTDLPTAWQKAEDLNKALDAWRKGTDQSKVMTKGTVSWLFAWYRGHEKFKKLKAKTRDDYRKNMNAMEQYPMKNGGQLGDRLASSVDAVFVDKIYLKLIEQRGKRQATYFMQVCRLVWNQAKRPGYDKITGVISNPFAKMGLSSTATIGNRETSRPEYNRYRMFARQLGYQSMATAAAIAFELVQRVWDVFGFDTDDGDQAVGALWVGYRPGHSFTITQSKGGRIKTVPLIDVDVDGTIVSLYPELEQELARTPNVHRLIVVEERSGKPYTTRRMSAVHRKICEAAGLPKEMTFTGFRHGGATEIGDSGEDDIRPISGHLQLNTTTIYNKVNQRKAVRIGRNRRDYLDQNVATVLSEES